MLNSESDENTLRHDSDFRQQQSERQIRVNGSEFPNMYCTYFIHEPRH